MLPIDLGAGGGTMLFLVLPNIIFYFGLCAKRWTRAEGNACPFLGGPACNKCRVCGTFVSDRAFHRTCSLTTEQRNGNVVTVTTSTQHGWDHCAGCQALKGQLLIVLFLLAMLCLWVWAVVERALAVSGITHRDERIRWFNVTMYMLTTVLGLIGWASILCARKMLLQYSCLTPCGCCFFARPSIKEPALARPAASHGAPVEAERGVSMTPAMPAVVVGVPTMAVCASV